MALSVLVPLVARKLSKRNDTDESWKSISRKSHPFSASVLLLLFCYEGMVALLFAWVKWVLGIAKETIFRASVPF